MIAAELLMRAFVRWFEFISLTALIGGLAFRWLIARPALLSHQQFQIIEGRLRRVEFGAIVVVVLTSLTDLIVRTLAMSGGNIASLTVTLPLVLTRTHFGAVWSARIGLLSLLGVAWWLRLQGVSPTPRLLWIARIPRIGPLWMSWWLRLLGVAASPRFSGALFPVASCVALTTTLSGHAADWGDATLPVLIDWLHLVAISIWIGGLFTFGFVLKRSLAAPDTAEMLPLLSVIARPFSRMATGCVAVFLATGFYTTWLQVGSIAAFVDAAYGWTLLAKLGLVGSVLMLAALNRYYFLTLLVSGSGRDDGLVFRTIRRFISMSQSQFSRFVRLEWTVVVVALACSALLTQLMPARHARHLEHLKSQAHRVDHSSAHHTPTATSSTIQSQESQ